MRSPISPCSRSTPSDLPTVAIGDAGSLKVGQWVFAIGAPFGLERTATKGIVSALGRSLPNDTYVPFIQTDVPINPGNSGGPLFDLTGKVVGINSQIFSRSGGYMGLSFAIPVDVAMDVVAQLKADGRVTRGWMGVTLQEVTQDLARSFNLEQPRGALVAEVGRTVPPPRPG
jgi:serine protease Do